MNHITTDSPTQDVQLKHHLACVLSDENGVYGAMISHRHESKLFSLKADSAHRLQALIMTEDAIDSTEAMTDTETGDDFTVYWLKANDYTRYLTSHEQTKLAEWVDGIEVRFWQEQLRNRGRARHLSGRFRHSR